MFTINTKVLTTTALLIATAILSACSSGGGSSSSTPPPVDNSIKLALAHSGVDGSIRLTWNGVVGGNYRVHQVATPVADNSTLGRFTALEGHTSYTLSAGASSKEIGNLSHGTTYYFAVTSLASDGSVRVLSNIVSAQPFLSAPTGLSATAGDAQASLSWTGIKHASATYRVRYATASFAGVDPSGYSELAGYGFSRTAATSIELTMLSNGVEHFAVITAVVKNQESAASNVANFTPKLTPPINLTALSGSKKVQLNWDAVTSSTYKVYQSTAAFGEITNLSQLTGKFVQTTNTNNVIITDLTDGAAYYFVVTVVKNGVESLPSNPITVSPGASVPSNLQIGTAAAENEAIKLTWSGILEVSTYTVHQATESFGSTPTLASLSGKEGYTSYTVTANTREITNLSNGSTYYFVVTAIPADGTESTPSNQVSAMPNIAVPQNVRAETSEGQTVLTWDTVSGASYVIHQATAAFVGLTTLSSATDYVSHAVAVGSSKTIIDLVNGKTYHFVITAVRSSQHSAVSAAVTASPVLPAPTGLVATPSTGSVALSWTEVAGATYKVYYANNSSIANLNTAEALQQAGIASMVFDTTNTRIEALGVELYYFKVTALKADAESAPSSHATAQPNAPDATTISRVVPGYQSVYVNWRSVEGTNNHKLHYATESFQGKALGEFSQLAGHGAVSLEEFQLQYTVSGLQNGTTYYFVVTNIVNGVELPEYSEEISATPLLPAPLDILLTPNAGQVKLQWNVRYTSASYNIYYATESFTGIDKLANYQSVSGGKRVAVAGSTAGWYVNHTITGLTTDTYYFLVTTVLNSEESTPSIEIAIIPRLSEITGHTQRVNAVAFSPDGQRIVSGSYDDTVRIWNSTSGLGISTLTGHTQRVNAVAYNHDGTRIISGGYDYDTMHLWNATSGTQIASLTGHNAWTFSIAFNSSGTHIASGGSDAAHIWTMDDSQSTLAHTLSGHTDNTYVAFHPTHTQLITGDAAGNIRVWSTTSGEQIGSTVTSTSAIYAIAFSPNGERFAVGNSDANILIYSSTSNQLVHTLSGHTASVNAIAFTPDSSKLISGSGDSNIKIWDVAAGGAALATLTAAWIDGRDDLPRVAGHEDIVTSVAVSPDGKRIVSGSQDKTIRVWYPEVLQNKNPTE